MTETGMDNYGRAQFLPGINPYGREHLKPDRFPISTQFAERLQAMSVENAWKEMENYLMNWKVR
jgi:hypothetical protein